MLPAPRSVLFLVCVALWGTGCQHPRTTVAASGSAPVQHLVIDAGSSGTRFMLYEVNRGPRGCQAEFIVRLNKDSGSGLSDMCKKGTAVDWLNGQDFKGLPREHVVLLGTGGLRELRTNDEATYQKCWQALTERVADRIGRMDVIPGKREGELAWLAVNQELDSPGKGFSIVEIGGVSVQFATGTSPSSITSVSEDGVGANRIKAKLDAPAKGSCGLDENTPGNFENCRDAVERLLLAESSFLEAVKSALPEGEDRPVYGVGDLGHQPKDQPKTLSRTDLERMGGPVCAGKTTQEQCYELAYPAALLKVMNITTVHRGNPGPSWTQGAAIHEDYFPACHLPQ